MPIAFILLCFAFLVPEHFPPWLSWLNEVLVFIAALLLSWRLLLKGWLQPSATLHFPRLALVPITLALLAVMQWLGGILPYGGEVFVIFCYALLCSMCLTVGFAQGGAATAADGKAVTTPLADLLAWALLVAAMVSAFILLAQNFMLDGPSVSWLTYSANANYKRPGGHLFQANHAATLQVLGMVSALFLQARGRLSNFTTAALLLLFAIGMATTQSRTSVLSLGALVLWWSWKQAFIAPRTPRWVGVASGALIAAIFMAWRSLFNSVMGADTALPGLKSLRFETWPQLAHAAWSKPWLGWGINQTASAHNAVAGGYPPTGEAYAYSHNLILDMALWVGLPLTALLLLLTGVWVWRRARATRDSLPWYGLALALPVAVHSMLEYPFAYAYFLMPVMLGLGLAEGALGGRSLRLHTKAAAAILFVSTALLAWSVVEYLRAEEDYRVVRFETLRVGQTPVTYDPPKMLLLTQVGAMLKAFRLEAKPNMSAGDLTLLRTVSAQNTTPAINSRYALALALNGQRAEAQRQLAAMRAQYGEQDYLNACTRMKTELQTHKIDWQPDCSPQETPPK